MNTVTMLEMLVGVLASRPRKKAPNAGPLGPALAGPAAALLPPAAAPAPDPLQPNALGAPVSTQPDLLAQQPQAGVNQPVPQPAPQSVPTEASLRSQLAQVDLYDLSGERAAADALQREDAFKQQQIEEKAQQTKEFFAEQDRKQQETLHEAQKQTDLQVQERSQKEAWDQKQSQEMQAGMEKELRGLHEAARQEHQKWRDDFTQGICREDVTRQINKQIDDRTMAYHDRLNDIGTNPIDTTETVSRYRVKLEDGAQGQIDQQTTELHQEHFPEQKTAPSHGGPDHPPEPPEPPKPPESERPAAEPQSSGSADVDQSQAPRRTGPGITHPQDGPQLNIPGYGGRDDMRPAPETNQPSQSSTGGSGDEPSPPAPPGAAPSAAQSNGSTADSPQSSAVAEPLPPLKGHQTRHQYAVDDARYLQEKETEEAAENITEVEEKGHHLHEAFDQAEEAVDAQHKGQDHQPGPGSGGQPPGENLHVIETLAKGPSPDLPPPPVHAQAEAQVLVTPPGTPGEFAQTSDHMPGFDPTAAVLGAAIVGAAMMAKARESASIFAHEPYTTPPSTGAERGRPDDPQRAELAVKGEKFESTDATGRERPDPAQPAELAVTSVEFESTAAFGKPSPESQKIDLSNPVGQPVTSQTWEMSAPSLNPNLVDMYRQREIDLGHANADQTAQKFAADVKQIDAQGANQASIAPPPPAPAPTAETSSTPAPAPIAAPAPPPPTAPQVAQPAPSLSL